MNRKIIGIHEPNVCIATIYFKCASEEYIVNPCFE